MCGISDKNYEYYESHECDCEVDSNFVSYTFIIASYRETVLRCVESQIRIMCRMRLIVNECEMFESQHTLIGLDLTRLIN